MASRDTLVLALLACIRPALLLCPHASFHHTNVTLTGVRNIEAVTGCFEPTEALEQVRIIQIINQTVPVLRENAINNLVHLVDIICESSGVTDVDPGAFKNLPALYLIRLKNNNINRIRNGVFNTLPVSEIALINNNITVIEPEAFDFLPNLTIINLSSNKIVELNGRWFGASPMVSVLNLEENLITELPAKAFRNIRAHHRVNNLNISTNILLNDNRIRRIDDETFDGLQSLGWLFLQKNEIDTINQRAFEGFSQIDWLRLDQNKLNCIPEKIFQIASNIKYYLENNPLTADCIARYDIKSKNGGVSN